MLLNFDNRKDPGIRNFWTWCVFGTLGMGKSQLLRLFALKYWEDHKRKVLIADPSNATAFDEFEEISLSEIKFGIYDIEQGTRRRWTKGIRVLRNIDWQDERWIEIVSKHIRNACVIFDESRVYLPKDGKIPFWTLEFINKHRNAGIDLVLVSHNFMSLHKDIRLVIKAYILLPTGDKPHHDPRDPRKGEYWFESRSFPTELYHAWLKIQRAGYRPDRIIQKFVIVPVEHANEQPIPQQQLPPTRKRK